MKKRMQTVMPALLAMVVFLFLGSVSVQAQTFSTTGAVNATSQNGKTVVDYMNADDATTAIKTDYLANFPSTPPDPTTLANATTFYKMTLYKSSASKIAIDGDVADGVYKAFNEVKLLTQNSWPNLVTEAWYTDLVTLVSL